MSEEDRVVGAMLGMAAGDALGAGYEFQDPPFDEIDLIGGGLGGFAPGEWTDDTSMAVCIAEVTATGIVDLAAIGERFLRWARTDPPDIGVSTRAVLASASSSADLAAAAADHYRRHPRGAAGNGALMRTAPVALANLGDDEATARDARAVAELTHADPLAGDSCVLWCAAIDRAVRDLRLDGIHDGLPLLPRERQGFWEEAIAAAEADPPGRFNPNGYTVTALQAAHAAITQTPIPHDEPGRHLPAALDAAVRIGNDTDTVAAIAGMVLGARWGASAVPARWRAMLHDREGRRAADLTRLAALTARKGQPPPDGAPDLANAEGR